MIGNRNLAVTQPVPSTRPFPSPLSLARAGKDGPLSETLNNLVHSPKGWVKVPRSLIASGLVRGSSKLVYMSLVYHSFLNDKNRRFTHPCIRTLCGETHLAKRTVQRALHELEEWGWIAQVGPRNIHTYHILWIDNVPPGPSSSRKAKIRRR